MEGEFQEKAFRDLQEDERIKRLERQLKLTKMRRWYSSQLRSSSHMSLSGISSIHGDQLSSDFSFSCPSVASSKAGSIIISSSNNLRKNMTRNLNRVPGSASPALEHATNGQNIDQDRAIMPPPPAAVDSRQPRADMNSKPKAQAVNSTPKTTVAQNFDNQTHSIRASLELSPSENNNAVEQARTDVIPRHNDNPKKKTTAFRNWIVRLNEHGQIIIKGRIENGEQTRSKPVKRRLTANMVLSILNRRYHLMGDIYDVREELPEYIRGKFFNGFPTDWENVRQIWQGYVASGHSLQFRWPRPMADSDDDLRSDITDLTVANLGNSRAKHISVVELSPPRETENQLERSGEKKAKYSPRHVEGVDISSIQSVANKNPVNRAEISPLDTSCKINAELIDTAVEDNRFVDCNESAGRIAQNNKTQASEYETLVPRKKIDLIIDNLMNKNCTKEYIDKFIIAINCFNELFTILPVNNAESLTPAEDVHLNHNSNSQITASSNQINGTTEKTETVRNVDCSRTPRKVAQATTNLSKSNSFSLESFKELEEEVEESPSEDSTHFHNQSVISKRSKENPNTPTISRDKIVQRSTRTRKNKRRTVFSSSDSEQEEQRETQNTRNGSVNNSKVLSTKTRMEKQQLVAVDKINNLVGHGTAGTVCDSDVSILDMPAAHCTIPRILNSENIRDTPSRRNQRQETLRPNFSFCNSKKTDCDKENLSTSERDTNITSNQTIIDSSSVVAAVAVHDRVELSSIPSTKVQIDIHNYRKVDGTPNKSERSTKNRRKENKIETDHKTSERAGSDSENVSLRTSSRGRRILPVLDYWNGERVTLKGQELMYSPGMAHSASPLRNGIILKNSSKSPNYTVLSEPTLMPVVESVSKGARMTGEVLSEISGNRDDKDDRPKTPDRRITRKLSNKREDMKVKSKKKTRNRSEYSDTSSAEETTELKRKQKRRRVH